MNKSYLFQAMFLSSAAALAGCGDTTTETVNNNAAPEAKIASTETSVKVGTTLTFDGSGSYDSDGSIAGYYWDGADTIGSVKYPRQFNNAGKKTVSLSVVDAEGKKSKPVIYNVTVVDNDNDNGNGNGTVNQAPVAAISASASDVTVGEPVTFDGSASSDPENSLLKYFWNGASVDGGNKLTMTYDSVGSKQVSLIVEDTQGKQSLAKQFVITVKNEDITPVNQAPVAKITGENTVLAGNELTFDASGSSDDGSVVKFYWNGSSVAGESTYTHQFDDEGSEEISLVVEDNEGKKSIADTITVEVTAVVVGDTTAPEVTEAPKQGSFSSAQSITLTASDDTDAAADITIYYSTDGVAPTTASPKYTGQPIDATDSKASGVDLVVKTLAVDTAGNESTATFSYTIGEQQQAEGEYYSTNPSGQVGANKTITSFADWSEDMVVAQGAANDDPRAFRGYHEKSTDFYALFAAYDDTNLYLMVEMPSIDGRDLISKDWQYALDENLGMGVAINTGQGTAGDGEMDTGITAWNDDKYYSIQSGIDTLLMFHPQEYGTPGFFITDSNGMFSYEVPYLHNFDDKGVTTSSEIGLVSSTLYGRSDNYGVTAAEYVAKTDYTDMLADPEKSDVSGYMYQITISLAGLGIDKSYLESTGIAVMVFSTFGTSMMDALPWDPVLIDVATEGYSADPSSSAEKEDVDVLTVPLARIGKL